MKAVWSSFFSINERIASVTFRLNERYKVKVFEKCASSYGSNDEEVVKFPDDIQGIMNREPAHFILVMGDFNAKVRMKVIRETALRDQ